MEIENLVGVAPKTFYGSLYEAVVSAVTIFKAHDCEPSDVSKIEVETSLGLFVTLSPPTRPMKEEAVKAGYYESPAGASFHKIQILTVEGLLAGTEQARYPDLMRGGLMFKKTTSEVRERPVRLPGTE